MKLAKDVLQSRKSLATKTDLHALQFFDRVP